MVEEVMGSNDVSNILSLCLLIAYVLDAGFVSYVGSHGSRFDSLFLHDDTGRVTADVGFGISFEYALKPLACLDGFLDKRHVWVFQNYIHHTPHLQKDKQKKLSILTYIDVFADIWGPVWAEPMESGNREHIRKYHVSKGAICQVKEREDRLIKNAVQCHWYNWMGIFRRRFSRILPGYEDLPLSTNDLLLIGTTLRPNNSCTYTLQEFEISYRDSLNPLGPKPSTWKLDSPTYATQLAAPKVVTFQIQGNVRKIPETTMKQFIWDKWNSEDVERANPGILNNFLGVEISHCTGNARRVPLKYVLRMGAVQPLLERQIPGWKTTEWGRAFQKTLLSETNEDIFRFWNAYSTQRTKVGSLLRCVLDVLDSSGMTDRGFQAAFIYENEEIALQIDTKKNEWAKILTDSYLMATYALVDEVCLEYRRFDHTTSMCNDKPSYTALQSQVGLMKGTFAGERLRGDPHPMTFERLNQSEVGAALMRPESAVFRILQLGRKCGIGKELLNQTKYPQAAHVMDTLFRAANLSYGGMDFPRNRSSPSEAVKTFKPDATPPGDTPGSIGQFEIQTHIQVESPSEQIQKIEQLRLT
jgi:hypothetical protein